MQLAKTLKLLQHLSLHDIPWKTLILAQLHQVKSREGITHSEVDFASRRGAASCIVDHSPIRGLLVLKLAQVERREQVVDTTLEWEQRINHLFDFEPDWQGKPCPVLDLKQVLECFELVLLEQFHSGPNQILTDKLVQGLVSVVYNPRELLANLYHAVAKDHDIVHEGQLDPIKWRILS